MRSIVRRLRPNPTPSLPPALDGVPIIAVLGMHRSGTSAVTGMLEEQGIQLGPVRRTGNPNQPKGNRENPRLFRLDERILRYNGGSWWRPPGHRVKFTRLHLERRNLILSDYEPSPLAIKDPRMLVLADFWRDALERPIGVIRNPISVMRSLRARGGPAGELSDGEHLALWKTYNRRLLDELRARSFPVVDFERPDSLAKQVRGALRDYGIEPSGEGGFFEPGSVRHEEEAWRERVADPEALEIWDELRAYAGRPSSSSAKTNDS